MNLFFRKNTRVRKKLSAILGPGNGCVNFVDTWKSPFFLQEKTMSIKFLVLGGGVFWVLGTLEIAGCLHLKASDYQHTLARSLFLVFGNAQLSGPASIVAPVNSAPGLRPTGGMAPESGGSEPESNKNRNRKSQRFSVANVPVASHWQAAVGMVFRKRAEYCFQSTVSEKRTH